MQNATRTGSFFHSGTPIMSRVNLHRRYWNQSSINEMAKASKCPLNQFLSEALTSCDCFLTTGWLPRDWLEWKAWQITHKQSEAEGHLVLCGSISILAPSQKGPKQITVPEVLRHSQLSLQRGGYTHTPHLVALPRIELYTSDSYNKPTFGTIQLWRTLLPFHFILTELTHTRYQI